MMLLSDPELELLWKVRGGIDPDKLGNEGLSYLDSALDAPFATVVSNFVEQGILTRPSAQWLLDLKQVSELKGMLKASGLKVSGKKAELIDRLTDGAPEILAALVDTARTRVPSPEAWQLVESYRKQKKQERLQAELDCLAFIDQGEYLRAAERAAAHLDAQVIKSGLGRPSLDYSEDCAREIHRALPQSARELSEQDRDVFARVSAMTHLFGSDYFSATHHLPDTFSGDVAFDIFAGFVNVGLNRATLDRLRKTGTSGGDGYRRDRVVEHVIVRAVPEAHRLDEACRATDGNVYHIDDAIPLLPHEIEEHPCLCSYSPYFPGISTPPRALAEG